MLLFLFSFAFAVQNPFRSEIAPLELVGTKEGTLEVIIAVPEGFHLYKDMMHIQAIDPHGIVFQDPEYPKGIFQPDPANPAQFREHYEETVRISLPIVVDKEGRYSPTIELRYQGCKGGLCYKPAVDTHVVPISRISAPKATPAPIPSLQKDSVWRFFQDPFSWFSSHIARQ